MQAARCGLRATHAVPQRAYGPRKAHLGTAMPLLGAAS